MRKICQIKFIKSIAFVRTNVYNIITQEVIDMAKTANLYARIEPQLKNEAESILDSLGIPASNAITMFYKQIVLQRGLPFNVQLPKNYPIDITNISEEQINEELDKGFNYVKAGKVKSAQSVFDSIEKD